jgi:shikimate dehydrogenase
MRSISSISPKTKLCAIIGNPVEHSMSPALHNAAFEALGLDYVYVAFRTEDVTNAIAGMRALENFRGLSVTIPHKVAVIPCLDEVAPVDLGIGSVNTVINNGGVLKGLGTDGPGARRALLDAGSDPAGNKVTILGSGGAARAIAFDLAYNAPPSQLTLAGIIPDELSALVNEIRAKTGVNTIGISLDEPQLASVLPESSILIHATPVGMHPRVDATVVPEALLHKDLCVMDIVYNPLETRLLREAREKGLNTISGVEMFVNQAALQFEAWTGEVAPRELMKNVVLDRLAGRS